jgi:succinate dehydrogenase / fumarate reductase, flavoprotein subunit
MLQAKILETNLLDEPTLDARIPSGPIEQQWDKCRFDMKLVNPANRRKHTIIVVGAGLAGAAAAATLGQQGRSQPIRSP